MPGGDKSGPLGMGPMTGRGAGSCMRFAIAGFNNQETLRKGTNKGYGRRGCRLRRINCVTGGINMPAEREKEFLSKQVTFLEKRLQWVKERLTEVDKVTKDVE
ncbi:MAG: DUF5320 domain-containing protein [Candidatus Dehalobacter alkaniphilus]